VRKSSAEFYVASLLVARMRNWGAFAALAAVVLASFALMILMLVSEANVLPQFLKALLLLLPFVVVVAFNLSTKLVVGADGVLLRWLGTSRFIAFAEVARIEAFEDVFGWSKPLSGVRLMLTSGDEVLVPVSVKALDRGKTVAIETCIQEALDAYRTAAAQRDGHMLLRGSRPVPAWITALRGIGAGANADNRTASVSQERLWRIAEDPAAEPVARAGAVVALAPALSPEERAKLRATARETVSPKLRVVIEAAVEGGDDAALAAKLSELDATDRRMERS
jgi:hypothetical protein